MPQEAHIDFSVLEAFLQRLGTVSSSFAKDISLFLEGIGMEFLRIVQDEIIARETVDTRKLLASFSVGDDGNVWTFSDNGLTLEVGTNVEYADYVNSGHWTNSKGQMTRFVPGVFKGDRFIYQPGAHSGMVLKQRWVKGSLYWDAAIRLIEELAPEYLDAKLDEWLKTYFKDFIS